MEILTTIENGVCQLKLNRPAVFNSFNKAMALLLQSELDKAALNDQVRVIVLTGEGKAFCAGQDLSEAIDPEGPELQAIVRDHYNPIIERIRTIEKPIIAAVNGVAAGAGANIALACDLPLATKSAAYDQAISKFCLITDSGGITEETTVMGVPCMTLRNSTERPETVDLGTNELLGIDPKAIGPAMEKLFSGNWKKGSIPPLWDGQTSGRIVERLLSLSNKI